MPEPFTPSEHPWPLRLAVLLVCATFPLIWVGGLVTSLEAGMAVPDWPSTFGYNLFLYPWQTWFFGPWDIFVEHGHRLLAAGVGMITIALVVATWRSSAHQHLRTLAMLGLALVVFQGVLGGLRVLLNARDVAKLHACVAPAFFAYTAVLATLMSSRWRTASRPVVSTTAGSLHRLTMITAGLAYLQIVLGAQLRHFVPGFDHQLFRVALVFHLVVAALLTAHIFWLLIVTLRSYRHEPWLVRPAVAMAVLVTGQLLLGARTWIVNYGWPVWFQQYLAAQEFVVGLKSLEQTIVTTAHVATGALIFMTSVLMVVRSFRLYRSAEVRSPLPSAAAGVTL